MSFWWKVSSEAGRDGVTCRVNGVIPKDSETGRTVSISGESGWVNQKIKLDKSGTQTIEIAYTKDAKLSAGQDRAWLYGVTVSKPPVFNDLQMFPKAVFLSTADNKLTISMTAQGATSYQWKKDGVSLVDSVSEARQVSGATTSTLVITGITAGDSGSYVLEASNATGKALSRRTDVVVAGIPEITQDPVAPPSVKVGSPLVLSVTATGSQPMFYMWTKDDVTVQWSSSPVYQVKSVKTSTAGVYVVYAVNKYGYAESEPVEVKVTASGVAK